MRIPQSIAGAMVTNNINKVVVRSDRRVAFINAMFIEYNNV